MAVLRSLKELNQAEEKVHTHCRAGAPKSTWVVSKGAGGFVKNATGFRSVAEKEKKGCSRILKNYVSRRCGLHYWGKGQGGAGG